MKIQDVKSIQQANRFVEGTINDFENGIATKDETMVLMGEYTNHLMDMFWREAIILIKANPEVLNEENPLIPLKS